MLRITAGLLVLLILTGCGTAPTVTDPVDGLSIVPDSSIPARTATATAGPSAQANSLAPSAPARPSATRVAPSPPSTTGGPEVKAAARLPAADRLAGLRSTAVAWRGGGDLRVVPGRRAAPGRGRVYAVRVEVETGLDVDRAAFARFVMATLNDPRSWTEGGRRRFARTDGAADLRVVLASPRTSAAICRPLRTFGKLSCRRGDLAVVTMYRWVKAMPGYRGDRDGYRRYVINHEVGHVLGHGHQLCAGRGRMAPVMMQQTLGLRGCRPNPWPHP